MLYETLREDVLGRDADGNFALWKGAIAGITSGALGQFIANPTDLVKVQMQTDGKRVAAGQKPLYRSTFHCASVLYRQNGIRGMWRGWVPSCQRAGLVQLGDLTSYDYLKQTALRNGFQDGPGTHALASAGAGLVAAFFGTPADVVKTRVMNQPVRIPGAGNLFLASEDLINCAGGCIWSRNSLQWCPALSPTDRGARRVTFTVQRVYSQLATDGTVVLGILFDV